MTMLHDYMNFDEAVLLKIVAGQKYLAIYDFLLEKPDYTAAQCSRIENYSF